MARYAVKGRVALVTGAARGIGLETARSLVRRGASVAVVDLDAQACERAAASLGAGDRAIGLGADVTDRAALQAAVDATVERFGGLDIVVANAGIAPRPCTALHMDPEVFERVVEVDLLGVYRTVHAGLPHVVARGGHVVVVASIYAFMLGVGATPYAMAKAGVEQFGRALRVELAGHGASATVAYFGFIDTAMVHEALDADPLGDRLTEALPSPLLKRLPAAAAGEGIVRGIERRRARVILPRRWALLSTLRGITGPLLDVATVRDGDVREVMRDLDRPNR